MSTKENAHNWPAIEEAVHRAARGEEPFIKHRRNANVGKGEGIEAALVAVREAAQKYLNLKK